MSSMKTRFQIAKCSLSHAKISQVSVLPNQLLHDGGFISINLFVRFVKLEEKLFSFDSLWTHLAQLFHRNHLLVQVVGDDIAKPPDGIGRYTLLLVSQVFDGLVVNVKFHDDEFQWGNFMRNHEVKQWSDFLDLLCPHELIRIRIDIFSAHFIISLIFDSKVT